MRKCGRCFFGGESHAAAAAAAPSAACVLVFSSTSMHGDGGVLRRIDELAASQMVPRASSYCKSCRRKTWLCGDSSDLSAAALDFWHQFGFNLRNFGKRNREIERDGLFAVLQ